jgi:hypothetical protein
VTSTPPRRDAPGLDGTLPAYVGKDHGFSAVRNTEDKHSFRNGEITWRIAGDNYRTYG